MFLPALFYFYFIIADFSIVHLSLIFDKSIGVAVIFLKNAFKEINGKIKDVHNYADYIHCCPFIFYILI